jgi:hypothetical protein
MSAKREAVGLRLKSQAQSIGEYLGLPIGIRAALQVRKTNEKLTSGKTLWRKVFPYLIKRRQHINTN